MGALLTALSEEFTAPAPSHSSPGEGRHTAALSQQWKCTASGKVAAELLCVPISHSLQMCVCDLALCVSLFMCVNLSERLSSYRTAPDL